MSDEASAAPAVDAQAPAAASENAEIKPTETNGESTVPKEDEETAGKQATTEVTAPDGEGTAEVAEPPSKPVAEETTPAASGKKEKRKSTGGVPEHKGKKLNKKKSMPDLHLDCKPGEYYWARMKGHPPWPAIIADEQMLPETLLGSRPVSTARADGTLRDDFKEGGKNAKERTFPVMYLATNEFSWIVNTALKPLDPEECKEMPSGKTPKMYQAAFDIAVEAHGLDYFKNILKVWQEEQAQFEEQAAQDAEAQRLADEKAAKEGIDGGDKPTKKKGKSRQSKGGDDTEMEDAEAPKSSKKRKKDTESDADKPKKTPKVTKLNAPKTPNGETPAAKKASAAKSKKKVVQAPSKDEEDEEKPQMTETERITQRQNAILYLRHRLQKGFLARDQAPKEDEMAGMAEFLSKLEAYENLEPSIIRNTKVHKVLKAIVKINAIPKDEEYGFKKRSTALLEVWNKRMEAADESGAGAVDEKTEKSAQKDEKAEEKDEKSAEPAEKTDGKADTEMQDATETKAEKEPEAKADEAAEKVEEKVEEKADESADKMEVDEKKADPVEDPAAAAPVEKAGSAAIDEATDGEPAKEPAADEKPAVEAA